jgi:hypothetical protein
MTNNTVIITKYFLYTVKAASPIFLFVGTFSMR